MGILVDFPCVCVWHESIGYNVNIYPEQVVRGECTIRPGRKPSCEEAKAGGRHNQPSYGGPCKGPMSCNGEAAQKKKKVPLILSVVDFHPPPG